MKNLMNLAAEYFYFSFTYFYGKAILSLSANSEIPVC